MLDALTRGGWLAAGAVVVVERSSRSPEPTWVEGVTGERGRRYGETTLWYGRAVAQRGIADEAAHQPEGRAQ
jgi:16S rRNA (guanine966-N2)-methyltransferase